MEPMDYQSLYPNSQKLALVGPVLDRPIITDFPQIAVDGGVRYSRNPVLWVGDGDSGVPVVETPFLKKNNQDETDLLFCLNHIRDGAWTELHLFGFLGRRRDHEWANLGEVYQVLKTRLMTKKVIFYQCDLNVPQPKIYFYPAGRHDLPIKGLFSILSFEKTVISISGACEFSMNEQALDLLSGRGISNRGHGVVHLQCVHPLMVFLTGSDE